MRRELVGVLEIDQPLCGRDFGTSNATGSCFAKLGITGIRKCFRTNNTCQDPVSYDAKGYVILPGTSGNHVSTPDSIANSVVGDIDVRVKLSVDDWTPASAGAVISKWTASGNQRSWSFQILTDGKLRFSWTTGGITPIDKDSTVSTGVADGQVKWVRATLDVDNGAAGNDVKFWTSDDDVTWTQLGTTVTTGSTTSIFDGSAGVVIGGVDAGTASLIAGRVRYADVRSGINGSVVVFFDPKDANATSDTSLTSRRTGELWTINGTANLQRGAVRLRHVTAQAGAAKYNAVASINKFTVSPATLNLAGMDGKSESLLGQREGVTVEMDDQPFDDAVVDPYRFERMTGVAMEKYLSMVGTSGNYASTPDVAANSITGDLSIRAKVTPSDWTPAAIIVLVSKWNATGNQRSYKLEVLTDGKLRLSWSTDGTAVTSKDSTVAVPGTVDGGAMWVMATIDVNNGAAGNDVRFYKSTDFNQANETGTWTQVGTTVTTGGTTSIQDSTSLLAVGSENAGTGGLWSGKAHYADVRATFTTAGTPAAKFDPQLVADRATSFAAPVTGETWTINQSGSPKSELIASPAPYNPRSKGTEWGKWNGRNPYAVGYPVKFYEGTLGQTYAQMAPRNYLIDQITGPNDGKVSLVVKDLFAKIASRKAVCPEASRGELFADITDSATSFTLFPTGVGAEYPSANFYVCIRDEIILVGSRSGEACSSCTRGQLGTVADTHKDEDLVQLVAVFTSMKAHDIGYALFTQFGGIPTSAIDYAAWSAASAAVTELYTARIARPTAVAQLIGELEEQAGLTWIPDAATGMIDLVALRASAPAAALDERSWIVAGSFSHTRLDQRRVSQCWVHYGQIDPTKDLEQEANFLSRIDVPDLTSEGEDQYGSPSIKTVFSRFIPQFGRSIAESAATRIVGLFRDPPLQCEFRIPGDRGVALRLADTVTLNVAEIQDEAGDQALTTHAIVRLGRDVKADQWQARTLETKYGTLITDRTVYIENDTLNFNFRMAWESLFGTPVSGDTAKVVLMGGIFVGGGSTSTYAFDIGTWPSGVTLLVQIDGEILPVGGQGGNGGNVTVNVLGAGVLSVTTGTGGLNGGHGFRTTQAVTLTGSGVIRGGWPGGGGGGAGRAAFTGTVDPDDYGYWATGGGGGGGRGFPGGPGGSPGFETNGIHSEGSVGDTGTKSAQGAGGAPDVGDFVNNRQISGGAGGPGNGTGATAFEVTAQGFAATDYKGGGGPGSRGNAITGNSLVTFSWTGTIDGPTTG